MFLSATGSAARVSLALGVVLTAISFAALLTILGLYFAGVTPHPSLYWAALWGFPAGFALLCFNLLLTMGRRRHRVE